MVVQRVMGWRLDKMGKHYVNELIDMANAFGSIHREPMIEAAKTLYGPQEPHFD